MRLNPCEKFFSHFHSSVYFLECRDKAGNLYVKIGKAQNPVERVTTLMCGMPLPVSRLRYVGIPGAAKALKLEKELQKYLAKWRARGEWFYFANIDEIGLEHYEFGIPGQLNCFLCRGAWEFQEIDWPAYEQAKLSKLEEYKADGAHHKKRQRQHGINPAIQFAPPPSAP
jgi:hypothetical protein